MRKQVTRRLNPWDQTHEVGERVYTCFYNGGIKVFDLVVSTGWGRKTAGELSTRQPSAQRKGAIPVQIDGIWYWEYDTEKQEYKK